MQSVKISEENYIHKKIDSQGRIYREVRCPGIKDDGSICRAFICDEYIRDGRIRVTCFKCGKIFVMEFRQKHGRSREIQKGK